LTDGPFNGVPIENFYIENIGTKNSDNAIMGSKDPKLKRTIILFRKY